MTHGPETAQEERRIDADAGFDLSLLWLWPVLLLQAIVEAFSGHARHLKALRRADRRIAEEDWPAHVESLRTSEWVIRAYLSQQAERLLAGEAVDLAQTLVPAAPADWTRPEPKSARELFLRFEVIARIFANPMRHIARLARTIAQATLAADPRHGAAAPAALVACAASCAAAFRIPGSADTRWALGIRAPP